MAIQGTENMIHKRIINIRSGLAALLGLCSAVGAGIPGAAALSDFSLGVTYPFVQGLDYATYASRVGVRTGMSWVMSDAKTFFLTGTAEYHPYAINKTTGHMSQFSVFGGAELRSVGESM